MPRKTFTFDGKRYYIYGISDEDVAIKIALKKRDLEEGKFTYGENTLTKTWIERWSETYKKNSVSDVTFRGYQSRINRHILPAVGNLRIRDVKPIHLQQIMTGLKGYSKDYILKVEYTLKQIFASAVDNKLILSNPAESLVLPKAVNGTNRAITHSEREWILKVAEYHEHGLWIKTLLYCGLRPSETRHLQGRHIKGDSLYVEGTKSKSAKRVVPIPNVLIFPKIEPFDYVFTNADGRQLTDSNLRSMWKSFKRELNIAMGCKLCRNQILPPYRVADDLVPYCLRHTYCTDLQSAGVPINIAKELMGHVDINTTARIYTHYTEDSLNQAKLLINNYNSKDLLTPNVTLSATNGDK